MGRGKSIWKWVSMVWKSIQKYIIGRVSGVYQFGVSIATSFVEDGVN